MGRDNTLNNTKKQNTQHSEQNTWNKKTNIKRVNLKNKIINYNITKEQNTQNK